MPSGKKDIYGTPSKRLADPKDIRAEMGAAKNAATAAKYVKPKPDLREGTTSKAGARPDIRMPKPAKAPQVIRTTVTFKPTPMGKKK